MKDIQSPIGSGMNTSNKINKNGVIPAEQAKDM